MTKCEGGAKMMMEGSCGHKLARLNPGQVECMLLVGNHLTSKQIAQRLGISPHTVDQRIRDVLRLTGSPSRREAARFIKTQIERRELATAYRVRRGQSSGDPPIVAAPAGPRLLPRLIWPFAIRPGQVNSMGLGQRLFWISAISFGAFATSAMYLAGLESLARILASY